MFGFGNFKALAAAALLVMSAGVVQAATCTIAGLTLSTACAGPIGGNDKDDYGGKRSSPTLTTSIITLDGMDEGLFGINTWIETEKINAPGLLDGILSMTYDAGNTSGTWSVSSWAGISSAMLVVKAGNEFIAYLINPAPPEPRASGLRKGWKTVGRAARHFAYDALHHSGCCPAPCRRLPAAWRAWWSGRVASPSQAGLTTASTDVLNKGAPRPLALCKVGEGIIRG